MKILAKRAVEVVGHGIVYKGQAIDISEEQIDGRIAANFTKADGTPLKAQSAGAAGKGAATAEQSVEDKEKAAIEKAVSVIGREGIMRKLDDLGITYKPTHKTDYLAKLMLSAQGEI